MTPTICELLDTDVPLQCDGRPLTSVPRRRDPDRLAHRGALTSSTSAIPTALLEDAFGVTLEECSLAVLRDDHGKYVQFAGHHAFPPIFFDIDNDPEQLVNRAADPAYAPKVLDYAQRMLAWRMRHTERTLTGMKLTQHAGLVEYRAPRVR